MNKYQKWAFNRQNDATSSYHYWAGNIADHFTLQLCEIMDKKGITQTELAKNSGVSKAYISKILNGSTNFTIESMAKLALAVGCKIEPINIVEKNRKCGKTFTLHSTDKSFSNFIKPINNLNADSKEHNNVISIAA